MATRATPSVPLRIPIRFDTWYGVLSSLSLILPSRSYVEVEREHVEVRMDWAFRSRFPRVAVASVSDTDLRPWSRGIHGFAGRWLVNGSGRGLLVLDLVPSQRGYVMGIP